MFDNEEDGTHAVPEEKLDRPLVSEEEADQLRSLWHRHRTRDRSSAFFRDDRFVEWLARDACELILDEAEGNGFSEAEKFDVAQSIQAHAAAAKAKVKRIQGKPDYCSPSVAGSPHQVAEQAARAGAAPFLDLGVAAGDGRALWDEECSSWVRLPQGMPKGSYVALKVSGDSMLPLLHSADVMIISLDSAFSSGDIVVARLEDDGFVVKRVGRISLNSVELLSVNPAFGSINVPRSIQPVLGTVVVCWCDHVGPGEHVNARHL